MKTIFYTISLLSISYLLSSLVMGGKIKHEKYKESQRKEDSHTKDNLRNKNYPNLEEVIVVWKTHCDIGYTHPVPEVLNYYRNGMMDGALKLIDESASLTVDKRFVWMLPAWVMERVLDENQDSARGIRIEKAINEGRLVWHALPFTFESEAADLEELVRGLGSGTRLAKHFGQTLPTDCKLTDMPSQAWVLPSLLANAGIKFVHIGVNPWSPNPDVPNLFWWEGPDGSRVLTGYSFHNYGWEPLPPSGWPYKTWLCLQVTGDNSGPPSSQTVKGVLDKLHRELPGVRIRFGRPGDFADAIIKENNPNIPVIHTDMPDTWTHGQMSMPIPTKIHRQATMALNSLGVLNTELLAWMVPVGDVAPLLEEGYGQGCLFTEHTWGICGPAFGTPDHETWKKNLVEGKYKDQLATFEYHADYARNALKTAQEGIRPCMEALTKAVAYEGSRITVYNALPWSRNGVVFVDLPSGVELPGAVRDLKDGQEIEVALDGHKISFIVKDIPAGGYRTYACLSGTPEHPQTVSNQTIETEHFRVKFDVKRGGIASLMSKSDGRELAQTETYALGQFMHERFCKTNVDSFMKAYCHVYYDWYGFPYYDFNKPRLDPKVTYARITPYNWTLRIIREATGDRAELSTTNTEGLADKYTLIFFFPKHQPCVDITWKVENKTPELIPEGGWLCLPLAVKKPAVRVSHTSASFSPEKDLIAGCNRHLFSIDYGISVRDGNDGSGISVSSSDLPLWSLGEPGLWKYTTDYVPTKAELFANLYNNQWNTNYPLWIEGTWDASLRLWPVVKHATEEAALFTPSMEFRQELLAGYSNGSSGNLPVTQTGISLSRKGVRITAFCTNPDAENGVQGTLVRLWEQSGITADITLTLPVGFKAEKAQPVNLRGEKAGEPLKITEGKLKLNLKAYSPVSFILY